MQVSITFRHMEATQAIRDHVDSKISHLEKYLLNPTEVHVILSVEKFRHTSEIVLVEQNFKASADETTDDMYKSIDRSIDKLESQVKKHKKILQDNQKHRHSLHDVAVMAEKEYERALEQKESK
jgi:putative sigma-54 modulation protein